MSLKISIAPIPFAWNKEEILDFYNDISKTAIDIVYLGETVCSKRQQLSIEELLNIAEMLANVGIEVSLATPYLIQSKQDEKILKSICKIDKYNIQLNSFSGLALLDGRNFSSGPGVNIYNDNTLKFLIKNGLKRWVPPVELSKESISTTIKSISKTELPIETEIHGLGFAPISFSARCFTAREHDKNRSNCNHVCQNHPQGITVNTLEGYKYLNINGTEVQTGSIINLLPHIEEIKQIGIDIFRISPFLKDMTSIIECVNETITTNNFSNTPKHGTEELFSENTLSGFWNGEAGIN